jgi:hypothetical protein
MSTVPPAHPASLPPPALLQQCGIERSRGSGPGGQNRNKVETAIRLTHVPTGFIATASERRSQTENLKNALFRLRVKLAIELRLPPNPDALPSALWRSRCAGGRIACNAHHGDFPALLAEAMDWLAACHHDHSRAASVLGISPSQLVRLLKKEPAALAFVNQQRQAQQLPPLR